MGIFGSKTPNPFYPPDPQAFNPYPGGGIGGGLPGNGGIDTSVPVDPYEGQRPNNPGFFQKGGMGGKLGMGLLGGALDGVAVWGGSKPGYSGARSEESDFQRELVKAKILAALKGETNNDTPAMKEAAAMGMAPGTPEFNEYVRRARMKPNFMMMGNPETGQQIVNPEEMGGGGPMKKTLPNGQTAYWVQNGSEGPDWYDNAEGH